MNSLASSLDINYWVEQLNDAGHGKKGSILNSACDALGFNNKDAFYRALKKVGWKSGKAKRSDAGKTEMSEEAINLMVAILNQGVRENGKRVMDVTTARSILISNGHNCVSHSQVCRVLAARNASVRQLDNVAPHVEMKSLGPNHVHQTDPSYCLLYYPPGKPGKRQTFMNDADYYANKPDNIDKIKNLRVWRYVLIDHYSGAVRLFYFEASGETQANMFTFLMWCWAKHDGSSFMGAPNILLWDKGSANGAKAIKNVLTALGVEQITHEAGRPRAKGAVEVANNIVEKQFESRILFEPVDSVAELNESAWAWQEAFNANLVPGMNCKHYRHKQARLDVWLKIYTPQFRHFLRELPDDKTCRMLLTRDDETRKVTGALSITYVHPVAKQKLSYDLSDLENIRNGQTVKVSPLIIGEEWEMLIGVPDKLGDFIYHAIAPIERDEAGFRVDAPVFGEAFDRNNDLESQTLAKESDRLAFPGLNDSQIKRAKKKKDAPFNGALVTHSHLKNIEHQTHISPKGTQIVAQSPVTKQVENAEKMIKKNQSKSMEPLDLKILLTEQLGRGLKPSELDYLETIGGVSRVDVGELVEKLHKGLPQAPVLKIARL